MLNVSNNSFHKELVNGNTIGFLYLIFTFAIPNLFMSKIINKLGIKNDHVRLCALLGVIVISEIIIHESEH